VADVALVAMPFGPLFTPSIALSLLKPALVRRGISCRNFYFMLDYAERVGLRFYNGIVLDHPLPLWKLAGEWIFAGHVAGDTAGGRDAYVELLRDRDRGLNRTRKMPQRTIDRVLAARENSGAFLDEVLEELLRDEPRIVGFTSTFQQHVASLALAKRIKAARPGTFIIMGGANCEAAMGAETVRQFPFIDATLSGEGDLVFPEVVRRVLAGESIEGMPGIRTQAGVERELAADHFDNTPPVLDLDALPDADFDDYLARYGKSRFAKTWETRLVFETSRGCWWGERSHCTFCGLNGATMSYRSKSPERVLGELESMLARHPGHDVDLTDNILDLHYFDTVLPELARRKPEVSLFYETKSNLRKDQVRLLREAGVRSIQPGIESLSDPVLKLMRKGVTRLQNIQLLKWCAELGLYTGWNIICGFPGEPPEEYARMAELVPLLTHLPPPATIGRLRLDRFSPNFFDAERMGFTDLRPIEAYRHIYRTLPEEAVHRLAYYFSFRYRDPQDPDAYAAALNYEVYEWRTRHAESALFSVDTADHLLIWDLRAAARQFLTVLSGLERRLYLACDAIAYVRQLAGALHCGESDVDEAAAMLVTRGLMLRDGDRLLALAIPMGEYAPGPLIVDRFHRTARAVGEESRDGLLIPWNVQSPRPVERRRKQLRRPRPLTPSRFVVESSHVVLH
jgi:ribosomal peptide maturation radical SAM protein 1